jgi:hypothetical protein
MYPKSAAMSPGLPDCQSQSPFGPRKPPTNELSFKREVFGIAQIRMIVITKRTDSVTVIKIASTKQLRFSDFTDLRSQSDGFSLIDPITRSQCHSVKYVLCVTVTASSIVVWWSAFLTTNHEVPGSIPQRIRFLGQYLEVL